MTKLTHYFNFISFLFLGLVSSCQTIHKNNFQKMEWLIGTWQGTADGHPFYEHWERVNEQEFHNINFSLCNGDTVIDGRSKIEVRDNKIVYSNGNLIWQLKELNDSKIIFENSRFNETFTFKRGENGEWHANLKYPNTTVDYILKKTSSINHLRRTKPPLIEGRYDGYLEFLGKRLNTSINFFSENGIQKATTSTPDNLQLDLPFRSVCYNPPFVKLSLQDGTRTLEMKAIINDGKLTGKLTGEIPAELHLTKRKDTPPSSRMYTIKQLTLKNGNVTIDANLFTPKTQPFNTAVILIAGTGNHSKEEYNGWADLLASKGVAVLTYNKRNVTNFPNLNIRQRTSDIALPGDLESDILAAISFLKTQTGITSIGLFGFSQGAVLAPIVASQTNDVSFLVAVSGNVTTDKDFIIHQSIERLRQRNFQPDKISAATEIWNELFAYSKNKQDGSKIQSKLDKAYQEGYGQHSLPRYLPTDDEIKYLATWNSFEHDPLKYYSKLNVPVLAVFGHNDWFIPVEKSVQLLQEAYSGRLHLLHLKVYPNSDHFIKTVPNRDSFDFPKFAPSYIVDVTKWITEQSKRKG